MMAKAIILAALALSLPACGGDDGPSRISFPVEVAGQGGVGMPNDHGYTLDLTTARLHLGPVYFYSGEPLFAGRGPEVWPWRLLRTALGVGTAHAHPGHYQEGEALAESLTSGAFDLLSGKPAPLGVAAGVSGSYRSVQVNLSPAAGGHTVEVAGTAAKGTLKVAFSASLELTSKVKGIAFGAEVTTSPGKVRLTVDLVRWLERVDFSKLSSSVPVTFQQGSQADNALQRGVVNTSAFIPKWIPSTP